jgi:hypothetical protein
MYIARFSYNIKPIDRDRAMDLLARQVAAAQTQKLSAWLLVPLTRAADGASLVAEVELPGLDQFETFRERGLGTEDETRAWLRELSELLLEPPVVELFRIADTGSAPDNSHS